MLDLVDIFIKKQPTSPHTIRLILPLLDLIAGTGADERQLSDKATGLLRNRIAKSKDLPLDADNDVITAILVEIHSRAQRARSPDALATLNQCSLHLARVLVHSGVEDSVLQVYRQSLVDFATRKASALNTIFFQDFIRRNPTSGWHLRDDVLKAASKAVNVYRQIQGFQLLQVILHQVSALVRF